MTHASSDHRTLHRAFARRAVAGAGVGRRRRRSRASDPGTGDWPMWGGTPDRNMVSNMKGLPTEWDVKTKKNVKWVAELGSQSYGNPVVAGGMVFVGTNNELLRDPKQAGDRGVLMAFRESDGEFLWQQTHAKLESGRANDWPFQGVASSPLVEGERLYYVSNRGVVFCLDIKGFRDNENDGPVTDEKLTGQIDADVDLGVRHDGGGRRLSAQPVELVAGRLGRPDLRQHVERPGREPRQHPVAARAGDHRAQQEHRQAGVGGQLGRGPHPARPVVHAVGRHDRRRRSGGVARRATAGCAATRRETGKKLWEFDTNPKDSVWPRTRNELIATPVIVEDRVYIANGQDPEHGEGVGHFYAIDATKRGDITKTGRVWHFDKIRRSISTAAIADGLVYIAGLQRLPPLPRREDRPGVLDARRASPRSGARRSWSTARSTSATRTATSSCMQHGKEKKVLAEMNMGSAVYGTVGAGARRAVPEQPQPAVRARGEVAARRHDHAEHASAAAGSAFDASACSSSASLLVAHAARCGRARRRAGRRVAPVPRQRRG